MGYNQNQNNQQQNQNNSKKGGLTISANPPMEFTSQLDSMLITTFELAEIFNKMFKVIPDFAGCTISPNPMGLNLPLSLSLYFKLLPTKEEFACCQSTADVTNANPQVARYSRIAASAQLKKLTLTQDGKELLHSLMINNKNDIKKFNWRNVEVEVADPQPYGAPAVPLLRIDGLDIYKVLPRVFAKPVDENGQKSKNHYQFNINIIRPMNAMMYGANGNYLINISRLNADYVEDLCRKVGCMPVSGAIPIVRA